MTDVEVYKPPAVPQITRGDISVYADLARSVATTEFVPKGLRGNVPATLACMLYGRAIGVDPMIALREISVIDGNPTMSATLILGKVRQAGHSVVIDEALEDRCVASGVRIDNGDEHTVTWTMMDAEQAGLAGKRNWQTYRRAMLRSRAVTELARALFSDLFSGLSVYTAEELGLEHTDIEGQPVEAPGGRIEAPVVVDAGFEESDWADDENDEEHDRAYWNRRLFAKIGELDADTNPHIRDDQLTWDEYTRQIVDATWQVHTRASLDKERLRALCRRVERESAPFG